MTKIICHNDPAVLDLTKFERGALLFGSKTETDYDAGIGNRVRAQISRLNAPVSQASFDFLSIALAVTAADLFVLRGDADDGFARQFELSIAVANPKRWQALSEKLERLLGFLSGDRWILKFLGDGACAPTSSERAKQRHRIDVTKARSVCLFSGGLDSLIGAIDAMKAGRKPMLVSRASKGDSKYQNYLRHFLPTTPVLSVNDDPRAQWTAEPSTRTRSLLFLALAGCAASAISTVRSGSTVPLILPENGFIALNPPLTNRRIGALSTRTAHPYYLTCVQEIFDASGIPAKIENPYRFKTKGEALESCADKSLIRQLAKSTVSCGKWKRKNKQCGRCLPCLIRRASFHHSGVTEGTASPYRFKNLKAVLGSAKKEHGADLTAVLYAIRYARTHPIERWLIKSGPLPLDVAMRKKYVDVVRRGLGEVEAFLKSEGIVA